MRKVMALRHHSPPPPHSLCFALSTLCSWAASSSFSLSWVPLNTQAWPHNGISAPGPKVLSILIPVGQSLVQVGWAHPTPCDPELIPLGPSCPSSTGERLDPANSSPFPLPISCRPGEGTALWGSAPARSQPLGAAARPGGGGWWEHCSLRAVTVPSWTTWRWGWCLPQ